MSQNYFNLVRRYPGLVSYWRLNDPASSSQVVDYSAHNSLVGSYSGGPAAGGALIQEADSQAGSRQLSGGATASIPDVAQLRLTNSFSLEAWVAPSSAAAGSIIGKTNGGVAGPYLLAMNASGQLTLSVGNGSTQITLTGPTVPVGVPSRVAGSLFRNTLYLALNGTVSATTLPVGAQAITDRGGPVVLGSASGYMAETAIYNLALSSLQHKRNFMLGRQVIPDPGHYITVNAPVYS